MASFVKCLEGHAFDPTESKVCPRCGSAFWSGDPVRTPQPPKLLKARPVARGTLIGIGGCIVFGIGVTFIARDVYHSFQDGSGLRSMIDSVVKIVPASQSDPSDKSLLLHSPKDFLAGWRFVDHQNPVKPPLAAQTSRDR